MPDLGNYVQYRGKLSRPRNSRPTCGVRNRNTRTGPKLPRVSQLDQRKDDPRSEGIVVCPVGVCLTRQSSAGPIAIPRRTRIGSANAHNSVRYLNPPADWSVTNLAVQFRVGILPKRRTRPGSRDIVDFRADGTCLGEWFKEIKKRTHLTRLGLRPNIRSLFVTRGLLWIQLPCSTAYPALCV